MWGFRSERWANECPAPRSNLGPPVSLSVQEFRPERWANVPPESYVRGPGMMASTSSGRDTAGKVWKCMTRTDKWTTGHHQDVRGRWSLPSEQLKWSSGWIQSEANVILNAAGTPVAGNFPNPEGDSAGGICFMPFSEGPRNCVGQSLAKIEVLAVLATILGSFRVELDPMVRPFDRSSTF